MLLGSEECHTNKFRVLFEEFSGGRVGSFIDFGNEDKCAASLEGAVDFLQVRPEVVGPILQDDELMKQVAVFSFHTYGEDPVGPQVGRIRQSPPLEACDAIVPRSRSRR